MLEHETGGRSADGLRALEELRFLLLGRERQQLIRLRERLEDPDSRAEDLSEVIVEALKRRAAADPGGELSQALAPALEQALRESVRKDARVLAEALYPVMGPAIRRSIYESIRAMVESFNQVLSQALSIRGVTWRLEALRTGRPFAEVVLLHTLRYRVEQTFLIHRRTGALLHHLAMSSLGVQDPFLVSGMLAAIQDFMKVSFDPTRDSSLNTMRVGDLEVWVEQGPEAVLACVIRGHPPERVRLGLRERLEQIHAAYGSDLAHFSGDALPFLSVTDLLVDCLESQEEEHPPFRYRRYVTALAIIAIAVAALWTLSSWLERRRWADFVERLNREPGIAVTDISRQGGRYRIRGLRDPQSANPAAFAQAAGVDLTRAEFTWRPFVALDDELITLRAVNILRPPSSAQLSVRGGTLIVRGASDQEWVARTRELAPFIPGVRAVDVEQVAIVGAFQGETAALESLTVWYSTGSPEIRADQQDRVAAIVDAVRALLAKARSAGGPVIVEVRGHTDSTGTEARNSQLSHQRAYGVVRRLLGAGVAEDVLRMRGLATTEPVREERTEADRQYNRSVTFRVVVAGGADAR
jgi:OOP family OmpA-OmpF porin